MTESDSYSFLALGDSYTIGEGVPEKARWPNQLKDSLETAGIEVGTVDIIAQTGWTTWDLLGGIDAAQPGQYDFVSLLIGVNNQFQKRPFIEYEVEFNTLLDAATEFAQGVENVFVVSIPDYGVTPFGASNAQVIAEELDAYNEYAKQQAEARGIPFIDITEISRYLANSPVALAPDNLHPSGYQYGQWVSAILPTAIDILAE
ncbi:MAG: SGNH/GDSL hydrolase family protein [Saprospiraceae bacterium]|nr:SGNH/GDSL hydrolase family protein [Saprospiraceae bacterium]